MEGGAAFLLQLVVFDRGAAPGDDVGDDVAEIAGPATQRQRRVMFDQHDAATGFGHDDVAHMRGQVGLGGDEQQVQRLVERAARGQVHIGAVLHEGGVERGKARGVAGGRIAEGRAQALAVVRQHVRHAGHDDAAGQHAQARQFRRQAAIDEGQHARARQRQRGDVAGVDGFGRRRRQVEAGLLDRRDAGVFPVLVAGGRKAAVEKGRQRALAGFGEPGHVGPGQARLDAREVGQGAIGRHGVHGAAPVRGSAATSSQP